VSDDNNFCCCFQQAQSNNQSLLTGAYDAARVAIDEVVRNAKTPDEKLNAYTHRVMCLMSETSDYGKGAEIGLEILSKYGFDIPQSPTKTVMAKEEMKYKIALRNRSISCLTTLPIQDDSVLALCQQLNICAMCESIHTLLELPHVSLILIFFTSFVATDSGKMDVMKLLNWKIIQYVLKRGSISSDLAPILGGCALVHVRLNDIKRSNEFATTVQALNLRIRDRKKNYATAGMCVCLAMCLLQNFRSLTDPFLQSYKDFKVSCRCAFLFVISIQAHFACLLHQAYGRGRDVAQRTQRLCSMLLRCRLRARAYLRVQAFSGRGLL